MRVFEEISKIQRPEVIHPSDKKYSKALEKVINFPGWTDNMRSLYFASRKKAHTL